MRILDPGRRKSKQNKAFLNAVADPGQGGCDATYEVLDTRHIIYIMITHTGCKNNKQNMQTVRTVRYIRMKTGDVIGKYRLVRPLGKGGEGSIFLALHLQTQQLWAVKVIRKTGRKTDTLREAKMMRQLYHPNLPAVIDILETENSICLILEYIRGSNLEQILKKKGKLSEEQVIQLGLQLCDALSYLHSRNPPVLHLDLKPSNLILTGKGRLFLVDFGAAQKTDERDVCRMGTDGFAAPEQYDEKADVDERTDVYGAGAVLKHLAQDCPDRLENVIERCMQHDPADRYQNCRELSGALSVVWKKERHAGSRAKLYAAGLLSAAAIGVLVPSLRAEWNQTAAVAFDSDKLLEDASCATGGERLALYLKALYLAPVQKKAYEQLLSEILLDGRMDSGEEEQLRTILHTIPFGRERTYEEILSENDAVYGSICFQIGLAYWYGYSEGENESDGKRIALGWFEKAVKAGEKGGLTDPPVPEWFSGAGLYMKMGNYLSGSSVDEGYWRDLTQMLETDLGGMLSGQMELTFYADSLGQLTLYMQQILAGGVSIDELSACAERILLLTEEVEVSPGEEAAVNEQKKKIREAGELFTQMLEGMESSRERGR